MLEAPTQPTPERADKKMDWTAIGGITASISAARDIAKGLSATRDAALINEKTSALLEQLLKAQEGLLAHNTALLQLQSDLAKLQKENLELKATIDERGKYTLVTLASGAVALRSNPANNPAGAAEPGIDEAPHYVCQPCFSIGRSVVLQRTWFMGTDNGLACPVCKAQVFDK
ncbi:ABC transporter substrate-binding protein [Comamonas sp. E6]|nr:ABC transporter substrate-binding protein [Comamonas sp. E6]